MPDFASAHSHFDPVENSRLVVVATESAQGDDAFAAIGFGAMRARLRRWWKEQTAPRVEDETLDNAGLSVTRFVAPALAPLLLVPVLLLVREPGNRLSMIALCFGMVAIACALVSEKLERRWGTSFWLHFGNTVVYVGLITGILWTSVILEHPREHIHWVLFFLYFLLIGASGMSDDPRQPLCAGGLSIVGYAAIQPLIRGAAMDGSPMALRLISEFEWVANSTKIAVMVGATLLAMSSATRGRAVRRLSLRDGLTGLLNRHAFDRCLAHLAGVNARKGYPVTIAMIDIDHFKWLNDRFGHPTGDAVLRWIATRLRESFRATDVVARYGGEEFVVAFPDTGDARLAERLEDFRREIAETALREVRPEAPLGGEDAGGEDADEIHVTLSIGTAVVPVDAGDLGTAIALADERLYRAKSLGRNRIVGH